MSSHAYARCSPTLQPHQDTCAYCGPRPAADDLVHHPAALIGVVGNLEQITGTRTLRTCGESHFRVLPGRLEAKRKERTIHEETTDTPDPGDGRHVPPPEVPGPEALAAAPEPGGDAWPATRGRAAERTWPDAPPADAGDPDWPAAPPAQTGPPPASCRPAPAGGDAEQPSPPDPRAGAGGDGTGGSRPHAGRPPSKAATPGEPFYLPRADWRWAAAIAGLVAGAAPQALLELASRFAGGAPSPGAGEVTAASAIAIALSSLALYGWQVLAAWLFSLRRAGRSLALWGFRRPTRAYFWVVPLGLVGAYAIGVVHDIIVHPHQQAIVGEFPHSAIGIAMFIFVAVIMAPIFEESLFRGFLFRGLANSFGWLWGALISAAIFGAAHLQLDVFLPLAALGFVLAWAYHRTGSLWTNITMHALFNAIAVLAWALTG